MQNLVFKVQILPDIEFSAFTYCPGSNKLYHWYIADTKHSPIAVFLYIFFFIVLY